MARMSLLFPTHLLRRSRGDWLRTSYVMAVWHPCSWLDYVWRRSLFRNLETYVGFVGYPRSGHTLIGALLNAHPQVLIGNELHVARLVELGFRRQQIFALLWHRDRMFENIGHKWQGFDYTVPGAAQGRYETLKVIGDKRGGGTTWVLHRRPTLFEKMRQRIGLPLRIIHHIRNPLDNIARIARREQRTVDDAIALYREMAETINSGIATLGEDELYQQWHEDFIGDVAGQMSALCRFVGVEADPAYLDACQSVVFESPKRSRDAVRWTRAQIDQVEALFADIPFLNRYAGTGSTVSVSG